MDVCIGYILARNFALEKVISVDELIQQVTEVYQLLRYEFIEKLKQRPVPDSVKDRLDALVDFNEV